MADIFLSYSQKDSRRARQVAEALRLTGWDVWRDVNLSAERGSVTKLLGSPAPRNALLCSGRGTPLSRILSSMKPRKAVVGEFWCRRSSMTLNLLTVSAAFSGQISSS